MSIQPQPRLTSLYPPSSAQHSLSSASPDPSKYNAPIQARLISRTPSPTPSENRLLSTKGLYSLPALANLKKYLQWKYVPYIILFVVLAAITILSVVFKDDIINWLKPVGEDVKALPAGWLIPVAILIVLSFPPLFGHEIIAIVCGVIWGLGAGFGIVALGTLLGEIANFFVFRACCRARAEKMEQKDVKYGLLAHVVREGGFRVVLMIRLSLIPPHFTTVVFSVAGMSFLIFVAAAILSLPRQLAPVVIGTMAASSNSSKSQKIVEWVVIGITVIVTIFAMRYINKKIDDAKALFVRLRQKARQTQGQASPSVSPRQVSPFASPQQTSPFVPHQASPGVPQPFLAGGSADIGTSAPADRLYDQLLVAPQICRAPPPVPGAYDMALVQGRYDTRYAAQY